MYLNIQHFIQFLVEAPLAVFTVSTLPVYDATSSARLYLGYISHSSLQIRSRSVRLDGECCCTAVFKFFHRCLMWSQSGLTLKGIHRLVPNLLLCHLGCVLWIIVLLEGEPECSGAGFHPGCLCTWLHLYFPPSSLVSQFLLLKNIPTSWCSTTVFHCRDGIYQMMSGAWFPPDLILGINVRTTL